MKDSKLFIPLIPYIVKFKTNRYIEVLLPEGFKYNVILVLDHLESPFTVAWVNHRRLLSGIMKNQDEFNNLFSLWNKYQKQDNHMKDACNSGKSQKLIE